MLKVLNQTFLTRDLQIDFKESVILGVKKMTSLFTFVLTAKLAFPSIMNVDSKLQWFLAESVTVINRTMHGSLHITLQLLPISPNIIYAHHSLL